MQYMIIRQVHDEYVYKDVCVATRHYVAIYGNVYLAKLRKSITPDRAPDPFSAGRSIEDYISARSERSGRW